MATWSKLEPAARGTTQVAYTSTQAFTEAGPPASGDGIPLKRLSSVLVELIAPGVETFDGSGSLLGWYQTDTDLNASAAWGRARRSDLKFPEHAGDSVIRLWISVGHQGGRLVLLANGIGHSGAGTSFTLNLYGAPEDL